MRLIVRNFINAHCLTQILLYSFVMALFTTKISVAYAKDLNSIKIDELVKDINQTKSKILNAENSSREVQGNLFEINKKIRLMSKKRNRLTDEMLSIKGDVKSLAQDIKEIEDKIFIQRKYLSKRLRTIYKMGENRNLQFLFSSTSALDLDKNVAFLNIIAKQDYKLVSRLEANLNLLNQKRESLKNSVKKLILSQRRLDKQESLLEKEQEFKVHLLDDLKHSKLVYIKQIQGIRQKVSSVPTSSTSIPQKSFFERKGTLNKPINLPITQNFGLLINREYNFKLAHKGVYFKSAESSDVRAIFNGVVGFIGFLQGYGYTLIIDHGDRYYSVYGNGINSKLKVGDKVSEGEIIGKTGTINNHSGLYFEVRHFSDPIDPNPWFNLGQNLGRNDR